MAIFAKFCARGKKVHTRAPPGPPWDPRFDPRKRRYADHIRPQSAVWLHLRTVAIATSSDTTLHVDGEVLHPDELVINACMLVVEHRAVATAIAYGVASQRSARSMQCDASHAEVHDVVASRNVSSDIATVEAMRRGEMRQHLEHRRATLRRLSCRARVAGRTAGTSRRPAAAGGTPAEVGLRPGEDFSF